MAGINVNELISDTKACSQKIKMITGKEPTLYRPICGEYDDDLITTIKSIGLKPIQWNVEPIDTDGNRSMSRSKAVERFVLCNTINTYSLRVLMFVGIPTLHINSI